ncbi:hypothetical protein FRC01_003775 [Tulasnella sp. 417]|nr:hypothetical protein FRC01_003775 [Tulasnella sp. 417]
MDRFQFKSLPLAQYAAKTSWALHMTRMRPIRRRRWPAAATERSILYRQKVTGQSGEDICKGLQPGEPVLYRSTGSPYGGAHETPAIVEAQVNKAQPQRRRKRLYHTASYTRASQMTSIQRNNTETHFDPKTGVTDSQSTNLLRRSNDEPTIYQLPIELLLPIFEWALKEWYYGHGSIYYRHLCALSTVCTRWHSIIQHSPQLWATVPGSIKEEGIRKVLERSSDTLLDIEYNPGKEEGGRYPDGHITPFFDILGSASGRWRTLNLTKSVSEGQTRKLLLLPAPNLEQLTFEDHQSPRQGMENVDFFGGNCPKLKDIHIYGLTCKWDQAAFKGLEALKLSDISFDSVAPILDIIRPLPLLRRLEVLNCHISEDAPASTQPVSLPNLQFLRVEFDNTGVITYTEQFISRISASPSCPLYVSFADLDDDDDCYADAFCQWLFGRQTKAVLASLRSLKLGFTVTEGPRDPSLLDFELFSDSVAVKGGFNGYRFEEYVSLMAYIQGLFQRSATSETFTQLTLSGDAANLLYSSELIAPFTDLPPITKLELVKPVWDSLSSSKEDASEESSPRPPSSYSAIKDIILRAVPPDSILDIILGTLGDLRERTLPMKECRVGTLDYVEIHAEEKDFREAEAAVKVLRNDPRIGKVNLYIAL